MKTLKSNDSLRVSTISKLMCAPLLVTCIIMLSCNGQTKKENLSTLKGTDSLNLSDTLNTPQINVKVNKHYDKNGNLIQFNSTYSYVYRGNSDKKSPLSNDSIFNGFKSYFVIHSPGLFERQNKNIFFNDSLLKYDFFNEDYFQKRFELNQKLFSDFYKQMDSLKGSYLRETYPGPKTKKNH